MNALARRLSPGATDMIRMDHTRVVALFHRYALDAQPKVKQGLVQTICLALEIHARMEEDIFYPALRAASSTLVEDAVPEHEEIRNWIAALRDIDPASEQYDATVMELMRTVMHHVADEETSMLPEAERLLGDRLGELGARMARRRLQLGAPRAGELARSMAQAIPPRSMLVAAGTLLAGALVLRRAFRRHA